jgi:hypothetical protein
MYIELDFSADTPVRGRRAGGLARQIRIIESRNLLARAHPRRELQCFIF